MLGNAPDSGALVAFFFLGKGCDTCICALIFNAPNRQPNHWYVQGKQPDQQYPLSLISDAKLVHPLKLAFQQLVVLVLINTSFRVSFHQNLFLL